MNFSVALCTYNGEKFIEEQLASIVNQTVPVQEIVIFDDASTDRTVEIIESFIARNIEPIAFNLFVNSKPLGISRNFEACISATSHEWIFLSDQDDVWRPNKIEILRKAIEEFPNSLLFCTNANLVTESLEPLGYSLFEALSLSSKESFQLRTNEAFSALLRRNLATGATMLLHKSLFMRAVPFPESWVHDEWLAIISAYFNEFMQLSDKTISYRQHSSNSIGATKLSLRRRISKYREPRSERNAHLVQRAIALEAFTESHNNIERGLFQLEYDDKIKRYSAFHRKRLLFPTNRLHRIFPILGLMISGQYSVNALGVRDAFKDFIQPA